MPVLVEPDSPTAEALLVSLPPGTHVVRSPDRMAAWLESHHEEYVVALGPGLVLDEAVATADWLRTARPTLSAVLVRDTVDTDSLTRAMKAGARDVVTTGDAGAVADAVRRAHQLHVALRGPSGAVVQGRAVTVFSPKGGVGKTTMAVNLALALAEGGAHKVCLVDLDVAFGDVAITLQLFPSNSIEQAIGAEDSLDQAMLDGLLTRTPDGVMVLAAPAHPDVRERLTAALVGRILQVLKADFDYVVVDTAPTFDDLTLAALDETDECVVVTTLDVPTLKNVKVAMETLDLLDIARGHRSLLLNRADDAVGLGADKVEEILGMQVTARVGTAVEVAAATNAGRPIVAAQPGHSTSVAIRGLAALLAGDPVVAPVDRVTGEAGHGRRRRFGKKAG